jgi:uncharacterized membrane protein YdbT with pleckstrin-like domain
MTQLMPDETEIALTRQHWSVIAAPVVAAVVLIVAVIIVLVLLPAKIGSAQTGTVKTIVGIVLIALLVLWALLRVLRWRLTTYLLTNRRIVMETGVLSRNSESISLDRVQNTVIRRPLGDRMIGAGDIEIESAGRDGAEILRRIPKAQTFYTQLLDAMETMRTSTAPPSLRGGV